MADSHPLDQIAERVERLLLRHEELQRTNQLLLEQVQALQSERDSLRSRLNAARARIDALLEQAQAQLALGAKDETRALLASIDTALAAHPWADASMRRELLLAALERARYNQRQAADLLKMSYHQFRWLYRKHRKAIEAQVPPQGHE